MRDHFRLQIEMIEAKLARGAGPRQTRELQRQLRHYRAELQRNNPDQYRGENEQTDTNTQTPML